LRTSEFSEKISNFHISFSDTLVNTVKKIKTLGVIVDCTLDWSYHAEKVAKTCNFKLWKPYPLKFILLQDAKVTLIHAFVFSVLNYMSVIWLQPKHYLMYNSIVKRAGRFIFNLDIFSPVSDRIVTELGWLFAKLKVSFELRKFCFNFFLSDSPVYFHNYINPNDCLTTTTRSGSFISPSSTPKTKFGKTSIKYRCLKKWCTTPSEFKTYDLFESFKNNLFNYMVKLQIEAFLIKTIGCDLSCIDNVCSQIVC